MDRGKCALNKVFCTQKDINADITTFVGEEGKMNGKQLKHRTYVLFFLSITLISAIYALYIWYFLIAV